MISKFAKITFVLTSLAPVLISYAISQKNLEFEIKITLCIISVVLFLLAWVTLSKIKKSGALEPIKIVSLKNADHEVLAYLVTYLVPFLATISLENAVLIYLIISISIYNSNAYHYNPLIGLLGYHFYQIETEEKISYILTTKREIRNISVINTIIHITDYLVIDKD